MRDRSLRSNRHASLSHAGSAALLPTFANVRSVALWAVDGRGRPLHIPHASRFFARQDLGLKGPFAVVALEPASLAHFAFPSGSNLARVHRQVRRRRFRVGWNDLRCCYGGRTPPRAKSCSLNRGARRAPDGRLASHTCQRVVERGPSGRLMKFSWIFGRVRRPAGKPAGRQMTHLRST